MHLCTPPSSTVTLRVTPSFPFRLIWPTSMIDRLRIPCMRSRDGFFLAVMTGEGVRWRGRTRSTSVSPSYLSPGSERHETQLELSQPRRQSLLFPLTKHQRAMNAKSRRLFPGSAQQPSRMNVEPSKARKTKGWRGRCWICAR